MKSVFSGSLLVLSLLSVTGMGATKTNPIHPIPKSQPAAAGDDLIFIGEDGKQIALSELKGKVVFINFWATWCMPCVEEMPTISDLKQKFKGNDNIVFLMLNIEGDLSKAKKFMESRKLDLPVYVAGSAIPATFYQGAIPTTLIFNKEGELEANTQGARNFANPEIYTALKELTEK